jgi:hypothetical protein
VKLVDDFVVPATATHDQRFALEHRSIGHLQDQPVYNRQEQTDTVYSTESSACKSPILSLPACLPTSIDALPPPPPPSATPF